MSNRDLNRAVILSGMFPEFTAEEILEGFEAERAAIAEHERRESERAAVEGGCCPRCFAEPGEDCDEDAHAEKWGER